MAAPIMVSSQSSSKRGTRTSPSKASSRRHFGGPTPYILVGPAVVLFVVCIIMPAIYAIYLSFRGRKVSGTGMFGGESTEIWVGLQNYASSLGDPELWASILRMLTVAVIGVPLTMILALVFALCLDGAYTKLRNASRILIFLPYAVPGVIASLMWGFLYLPGTSPIGGASFNFFGSTQIYFSVANIAVWGAVGFNMLIMYTGLRSLPQEIYESARLDGASELQIAIRIKVPLIRPALIMCGIFSLLGALQLFNEPTALKPLANIITNSWVPLMKVQTQAFTENNIYGASATAIFIAVSIIALTVIANTLVARRAGKNR